MRDIDGDGPEGCLKKGLPMDEYEGILEGYRYYKPRFTATSTLQCLVTHIFAHPFHSTGRTFLQQTKRAGVLLIDMAGNAKEEILGQIVSV